MELVLRNGQAVKSDKGFTKWMVELLQGMEERLETLWEYEHVHAQVLVEAVLAIKRVRFTIMGVGVEDGRRARGKGKRR